MSRLREELKLIPRPVFGVALVLSVLCLVVLAVYQVLEFDSNDVVQFGPFLVAGIGTLIFVSMAVFILIIGYIYADARRRGMRPVLWVLLAIFIPNAIGIILYFILREPLLVTCPKCGTGTKASFPFCPACGESLANVCPSCKGAVESTWSHCSRCGAKLSAA